MSRYERRRRRHRSGAGGIVGAIWLIGLGVIFLLTETIGWSWGEAWPLFVILVGLGSLVSRLVWDPWRRAGPWGLTWPLAILAVGVLLLLSTTGTIGTGPGELVGRWWPVALIVLGAWFLVGAFWPRGAGSGSEHLALPLAGASSASVRLRFGAGTLAVGRAAPGSLVDGVFEGGVAHRVRGPGDVELEPDPAWRWAWFDRPLDWRVGLTGDAPLDLRVETGAARAELDLAELQLRSLRLETGASETRVRLPRAAGETRVSAEGGAARVTLEVPAGVAARIRSRVALGSTQVDSARFPRSGDGYESTDFAGAANRVEIELAGGVGSFRVVSV